MKLALRQIDEVRDQTAMDPIPQTEAVVDDLKKHFGDHTFYLHEEGLCIWEPIQDDQQSGDKVQIYKIASWTDEAKNTLAPHDPMPLDTLIVFVS